MSAKWPEFLARCKCGEILVNEGGFSSWIKSESVLKAVSSKDMPSGLCPGCGGDPNIPVGAFLHPRFYQEVDWER
ncbi:MAG: hypothetical protein WC906_02300 [Parcubacteria group bacterium]|jgi:hypothetical protein